MDINYIEILEEFLANCKEKNMAGIYEEIALIVIDYLKKAINF